MTIRNPLGLDRTGITRLVLAGSTLPFLALLPPAHAQEGAGQERPPYKKFMRQEEDWSDFDPTLGDDFFDPIKHIDLDETGTWWLSIGGSARTRVEIWDNFAADSDNDDGFINGRLFLHADLHAGEHIRFFVQGKSSHVFSRDNLPGRKRKSDVDTLALQQAFADLTFVDQDDLTITLRPGRQMLKFGRQRLVSPLMWSNTRRAWDGISAKIEIQDWDITPFYTLFVPVQKFEFNDHDPDIQFFGAYATGPLGFAGVNADAYFLALNKNDDSITFNGTTGPEERYTIGARLFGDLNDSGLSFDLESAFQVGEVGPGDISAFMVAAELRQHWRDHTWAPSLACGFDYASGDSSAGGDVQTFNSLFPLGHGYFGAADVIGRQNLIALSSTFKLKPTDRFTFKAQGHVFWRADTDDAVYNPGGKVVVDAADSGSSYTGSEIDLKLAYDIDLHTNIEVGYSYFFSGDAIEDGIEGHDDVQLIYLQVTFIY